MFVIEFQGIRLFYIETGNQMIGGMYGLMENIKQEGFLLGGTYADYLLRSPPAFLGLERPLDLAWKTSVGDQVMSQGGVFEPAEAYANFGLLGCFAVSFILSYFMAFLLKTADKRGSILFASWYLVFGLTVFRDVWYQTFAYYRLGTIFLLLILILWFVRPSLIGYTRKRIYR